MDRLVMCVTAASLVQDRYGDKAIDVPAKCKAYAVFLRDTGHSMDEIIRAIKAFVLKHPKMPTPSEILDWIDRTKPVLALPAPTFERLQWHDMIAEEFGEAVLRSWFQTVRFEPESRAMYAPTPFMRDWITNTYKDRLERLFGTKLEIESEVLRDA